MISEQINRRGAVLTDAIRQFVKGEGETHHPVAA